MPQGRLKAGSAELERSGKRTARCGWILRRVGLYADRAEVPFGKLLGLPFMRLSGRRADCLPRMVDLAAKCFFRRPQSMEAV